MLNKNSGKPSKLFKAPMLNKTKKLNLNKQKRKILKNYLKRVQSIRDSNKKWQKKNKMTNQKSTNNSLQ
jgi:hypothetical protein